jgi:hypothetical protein
MCEVNKLHAGGHPPSLKRRFSDVYCVQLILTRIYPAGDVGAGTFESV